jgi:nucleotide-binding universal stress UspA family protein
MFRRIVVAVQAPDQGALDLVQQLATEGVTEVQVLHLRERELSGPIWYSRESGREAGYLIEAAVFELRMAGIAAAGNVRPAIVDRVAEAILAEAEAFGADLIVLGSPRRGEVATRLFGSVTLRVLRRSGCPVIVAPRRGPPAASRPFQARSGDKAKSSPNAHHVSPNPESVVVEFYRI